MIYGVMLRNAEGEGTDFFACVAENFNEAQEICEEQFVKGTDFTIINAEAVLNYQCDGFARLGTCYTASEKTLLRLSLKNLESVLKEKFK